MSFLSPHQAPESPADGEARRAWRMNEVRDELATAMKNQFPDDFVCYSDIQRIWSHDHCLEQVLYDNQLSPDEVEYIKTKMIRLISFLVWIRLPSNWFSSFKTRLFGTRPDVRSRLEQDIPVRGEDLVALGVENQLVFKEIRDQYIFAPVSLDFGSNEVHEIEQYDRLPLISTREPPVEGGFGKVEFFEMPHEYIKNRRLNGQEWRPRGNYLVAVKTIRTISPKQDFQEEVDNLKILKLNSTNCPNVLLHDAAIQKGNAEFLIVFPRAMLGDLFQFLFCGHTISREHKTVPTYDFESRFPGVLKNGLDIVPHLLRQCCGLAEGLRFLHNSIFDDNGKHMFFAHMDLKPNNILLYPNSSGAVGKWVICDFGISALKEGTRVGQWLTLLTKRHRPRGTYQAPEINSVFSASEDMTGQNVEGLVGRSSDIWSFGAILVEVLAFALGRYDGTHGVKELYSQRIHCPCASHPQGQTVDDFCCPDAPSGPLQVPRTELKFKLRPSVDAWLREKEDMIFIQDPFKKAIITCWIRCIRGILQVKPERRPKADGLCSWIYHVKHQASRMDLQCIFPGSTVHSEAGEEGQSSTAGRESSHMGHSSPDARPSSGFSDPEFGPSRPRPTSVTSSQSGNYGSSHRPPIMVEQATGYTFTGSDPALSSPNDIAGPSIEGHFNPTHCGSSNSSTPANHFGSSEQHSNSSQFTVELTNREKASLVATYENSVVYVVKNELRSYTLSLSKPKGIGIQPNPGHDLNRGVINVDWKGLSLAGDYVVIWGRVRGSTDPLIRVYRKPNPGQGRPTFQQCSVEGIPADFDPANRISASRKGFIAVIGQSHITVWKLRATATLLKSIPLREFTRDGTVQAKFKDVCFDPSGNNLYIWVTGLREEIVRYDFSSELVLPHEKLSLKITIPDERAAVSNSRLRLLLSADKSHCLASISNREKASIVPFELYPGQRNKDVAWPTSRISNLDTIDIRAAHFHHGHGLFVVQHKTSMLWRQHFLCLKRYKFQNKTWDRKPQEFKLESMADGLLASQMAVVNIGNDLYAAIFHLSGQAEVVRIDQQQVFE